MYSSVVYEIILQSCIAANGKNDAAYFICNTAGILLQYRSYKIPHTPWHHEAKNSNNV